MTVFNTMKTLLRNSSSVHDQASSKLFHYVKENEHEKSRIHLRIDPDGTGTLIVNANRVMHLNPTAAFQARLLLEGKTEQLAQVGEEPFETDIELADASAQLLPELQRGVPLFDLKVRPQDLHDRQVRRVLTMGHAVAFQPDDGLSFQGPAEFIQETRFPDAWLADDAHDLSAPGLDTGQAVEQEVELPLASHQG